MKIPLVHDCSIVLTLKRVLVLFSPRDSLQVFVEFPTIVSAILGLRQAGMKKHITVFSPALEDGWTAHVDARGLTYENTHTHTHTHIHTHTHLSQNIFVTYE